MAQATMLMCGFSGQANALKKQPLLLSQIQKIKPDSSISRLFFSLLPLRSSSSSSSTTFALFKSKTKAPPKKVERPKEIVEDGIFGTSEDNVAAAPTASPPPNEAPTEPGATPLICSSIVTAPGAPPLVCSSARAPSPLAPGASPAFDDGNRKIRTTTKLGVGGDEESIINFQN